MEHSHILLNFLVIITMVFIASANDGGYKLLRHGEDVPAYPWQRVNLRERGQRVQKSNDDDWMGERKYPQFDLPNENGTIRFDYKRKSNFDENIAEVNNFERGFGVKVIYGRVPVPVILLTYYDKPKN